MRLIIAGIGLLSVALCGVGADKILPAPELPASSPWDLLELSQVPEFRWTDEKKPIRSLIYEGAKLFGEKTEVFAFYATPETIGGNASSEGEYPAVVLVHGGGGTAFAEWVWLWANRGYAAVAMDLSGHRPPAPVFDPDTGQLLEDLGFDPKGRKRLEYGGPDQGHQQKFDSIGGEVSDDWPYHAVANVIRAHSLIRSFREINVRRTAVTGISWGGYTTCLVASIDNRFAAAVPVYGCGFLHEGESVQKPAIDNLDLRDEWVKTYDPSRYLRACRVPIFFVNGTNDKHYPLDSYARSYSLVQGPRNLRIQVNMPHSHRAGWVPDEIGLFIDQYCRDGKPLPVIGNPKREGNIVVAGIENTDGIKQATLHYTADRGPLVKRKWKQQPAALKEGKITAPMPSETPTIWLLSATSERGAMVTSEVVFAADR